MAVAALHGLEASDALQVADSLNTDNQDDPDQLPASCGESADALEASRDAFEEHGVFPASLIDSLATQLRSFDDTAPLAGSVGDREGRANLIRRHWHVG